MKRATLILMALALLLGGVGQAKADIMYALDNYTSLQNGNNIAGTITTNGTIGTLTDGDIVSWTITVNGTTTMSSGGSNTIDIEGSVSATATAILLNPYTGAASGSYIDIGNDGVEYYILQLTQSPDTVYSGGAFQNNGGPGWQTNGGAGASAPPGSFVYAGTEATAAAPEPTTLAMLGMASASFAGYFGWRRRRQPVTA